MGLDLHIDPNERHVAQDPLTHVAIVMQLLKRCVNVRPALGNDRYVRLGRIEKKLVAASLSMFKSITPDHDGSALPIPPYLALYTTYLNWMNHGKSALMLPLHSFLL